MLTAFRLIMYLRKLILSKHAKPGTDFNALIEKTHKDANLKIFKNTGSGDPQTRTRTTKPRRKRTKGSRTVRNNRKVSLTDESSDFSEAAGDSTVESEDSVVRPSARRRVKAQGASAPFEVALRLFRATSSGERSTTGPSTSYGIMFVDNSIDSAARCFNLVDQQTKTSCVYIEFHPPEDMSLQNRIRIERDSEEADEVFEEVVTMLRGARKFPGEPSYRTVEVIFGADTVADE